MVINRDDVSYLGSVRTLLGVDRDDEITLTDNDINDMSIIEVAEMDIISVLPIEVQLYATGQIPPPDVSSIQRVKLAVIYTMAALLCPSMPSRVDVSVKGIDSGWTRKAIDYDALAEKLLGQANAMLDQLVGDVAGDSPLFRIAPSKRAVSDRECS